MTPKFAGLSVLPQIRPVHVGGRIARLDIESPISYMSEIDASRPSRARVFLSYAHADQETARYIANALKHSGVSAWFDEWELATDDSIARHIENAAAASDFVLVLLSRASVASQWIRHEWNSALSKELNDRAIKVLPILIEDCEIPLLLADRVYLDLRKDRDAGVQRLVAQLSAAPDIQFSELTPPDFELLIGDLLIELGFSLTATPSPQDTGFDFRGTFKSRDPSGAEKTDTWLVEAKFYRQERVSVSVLHRVLGLLQAWPDVTMGLIVTNGNLTSEARRTLDESGFGQKLRVIERAELTKLVVQHPKLIERYFRRGANRG